MTDLAPPHARAKPIQTKCGARTRNGGTCRNPPMTGARRCRMHGAATKASRRAARLRLLELEAPAIAALANLLVSSANEHIRLRAIENVLDRVGHPRGIALGSLTTEEAQEALIDLLEEASR